MAKKRESKRQSKIRKALEKEFWKSKWYKIHGGWFQDAGIADLLGCVMGLFFAFEVKEPDGELSAIQEENIDDIIEAGGVSCAVETPEQAIRIVYATLRNAGLISEKSIPARYRKKRSLHSI